MAVVFAILAWVVMGALAFGAAPDARVEGPRVPVVVGEEFWLKVMGTESVDEPAIETARGPAALTPVKLYTDSHGLSYAVVVSPRAGSYILAVVESGPVGAKPPRNYAFWTVEVVEAGPVPPKPQPQPVPVPEPTPVPLPPDPTPVPTPPPTPKPLPVPAAVTEAVLVLPDKGMTHAFATIETSPAVRSALLAAKLPMLRSYYPTQARMMTDAWRRVIQGKALPLLVFVHEKGYGASTVTVASEADVVSAIERMTGR
jgi:hypothetical protein